MTFSVTFYFLLALLTFNFYLLTSSHAYAITMSNDSYLLQTDVNMGGGTAENSTTKLTSTLGQTAPGLYTGTNYTARMGFQYLFRESASPFSFAISETLIDFGILTATNPVTRTNTLSVTPGTATGYTVTGFENTELTVENGSSVIVDTTCDNGGCSEIVPDTWNSTLTYGFGYRCDGPDDGLTENDCSSDFTTSTHYKQFSNVSKGETPAVIMSGSTSTNSAQLATITYKVNIPGSQAAGTYRNGITYIATPAF